MANRNIVKHSLAKIVFLFAGVFKIKNSETLTRFIMGDQFKNHRFFYKRKFTISLKIAFLLLCLVVGYINGYLGLPKFFNWVCFLVILVFYLPLLLVGIEPLNAVETSASEQTFIKLATIGGFFMSPIVVLMFVYVLWRDWAITSDGYRIFGFVIIFGSFFLYFVFRKEIKRNGWLWFKS